MNDIQLDFNRKVREINHYFRLVKFLDDKQHTEGFRITGELQATLKANCYLLLYNLVEGSIVEGLDAIFFDINRHNISFSQLNDNYKQIWLKYKFQLVKLSKSKGDEKSRKAFNKNLIEILNDLDIFSILNYTDNDGVSENYKSYLKTLSTQDISGNLDARKIKEIAEIYGFSVPEKCNELLVIKNFRNQLAHGEKTFSEIGREKTIAELTKINIKIICYLRAVLKNISRFIHDKEYFQAGRGLQPRP